MTYSNKIILYEQIICFFVNQNKNNYPIRECLYIKSGDLNISKLVSVGLIVNVKILKYNKRLSGFSDL